MEGQNKIFGQLFNKAQYFDSIHLSHNQKFRTFFNCMIRIYDYWSQYENSYWKIKRKNWKPFAQIYK